ncbi:uncharacterized protein LOC143298079 [Babylonia areolata]|uniref:uncharacterized protein LOC143298079 n=1 Tax=Babylonia areolata TaxID=304850 RepID=UPI003FD37B5B
MASTAPRVTPNERQPLHNTPDASTDPSFAPAGHGGPQEHPRSGYYSDTVFGSSAENPYGDTTEWDSNLRHMPLSEVIPRPWQSYHQIRIASYISVVLFLLTGVFAVKFAHRGRMHQSKGLMGMAQRDLLLSVRLIYASVFFGVFLYFIIIPVAAS